MEGKDENKPKIVYFILAVFIHANVFLPFLSEKTGVHGAFILCDIILAVIVYNLMARNRELGVGENSPLFILSNKNQ